MAVMGRPPKYDHPDQMQDMVDLYFLACKFNRQGADEESKLLDGLTEENINVINSIDDHNPTVCGLALTLNLTRQGLIEYGEKDDFSDIVKRAKQRIESYLEQSLYNPACTGTIFNLKNNFGWKDKHELGGSLGISHENWLESLDDG